MDAWPGSLRLTPVLSELGISSTSWYRHTKPAAGARGRPRVPLDGAQVAVIRELSKRYPYWGYKRLAVLARREFSASFSDRLTYRIMRDLGLLQRRVVRPAELHQSRQLFALLPTGPNGLWQMDVTYVECVINSVCGMDNVIDGTGDIESPGLGLKRRKKYD